MCGSGKPRQRPSVPPKAGNGERIVALKNTPASQQAEIRAARDRWRGSTTPADSSPAGRVKTMVISQISMRRAMTGVMVAGGVGIYCEALRPTVARPG
jgi:hypothetical protein